MSDQKNNPNVPNKKMAININLDTTPILYTDNIFISLNEDGVTLDICQKLGPTNQMRIVSRIGMSKSHAKKFVKKLDALLLGSTQKKVQTGEKVLH